MTSGPGADDRSNPMLDDVLAIPDHIRDALWRVDSARLERADSAGLVVCGMGGSAIGGDLAAAVLGERLTRPLVTVRGYVLPSWVGSDWTVLCSSYSGETEETLACFDAATAVGARRIVVGTGGTIVDRAREDGVPVVGLPGILQPRAAVAYMAVAAIEAAAMAGAAPRIESEVEAAAAHLESLTKDLESRASEIAGRLEGTLPVIVGGDLTVPLARRWKTQINENAKVQAFFWSCPRPTTTRSAVGPECPRARACPWSCWKTPSCILVSASASSSPARRSRPTEPRWCGCAARQRRAPAGCSRA